MQPRMSMRARAQAILLTGVVVSQFMALGAPAVANAAVASAISVGLYHGSGESDYQGFNKLGSAYPNPQNLTQWGTGDWRLWGAAGSTQPSGILKNRPSSLMSDLAVIPPRSGPAAGLAAASGTRPFTFRWTDGTAPNATGSAVQAGVKPAAGGAGSGFGLTVPLPPSTERLRLWVSAYKGRGILTATVPGQTVVNSEMVGDDNDAGGVFEIDVQGSGNLNVSFVLKCPKDDGCTASSHVTMYAAAYTWTGLPPQFSVDVTQGQQNAFTMVQGDTSPLSSSVTTRAINPPISQVALATSVETEAGDPTTGLSAVVSPAAVAAFPAVSTVTITPQLDVAAGTYHVTVTGVESSGAKDVNTANFVVTVLPLTRVPFLYRAFPNSSASQPGGGVTVQGTMNGDKNQTFRIQFYAATACSSARVAGGTLADGPTIDVPTDANGDAFIGNAINIPADTTYLTARVIAYRTGPVANPVWTPLGDTAYGPCIVVSDPNESWPWALPIQANPTTGVVHFDANQYLDDFARSRWYKFEIQPGSRVHVTVSGLENTDVFLFRDIEQTYLGGSSLTQQSASYAPPHYAPPTYAPPHYAPDSLAPPTVAPPHYAPPTYAPPHYAPPHYAPPTYAPPHYAPPHYAPPTYAPPHYAPPTYA